MTIFGTEKKDPNFNRELSFGARGADVKAMQTALLAAGYDVGKTGADGKFGKYTLAAWKKYEAAHKSFMQDGKASVEELAQFNTKNSYHIKPIIQNTSGTKIDTLPHLSTLNYSPVILTSTTPIAKLNKTVVLDIGHVGYGHDEGAEAILNGQKITEGQINTAVATLVKQKLEAAGVNVVISTGKNGAQNSYGGNLHGRAKVADTHNADMFVSIHTDSREAGCFKGPAVHIQPNAHESNTFAANLQSELRCRKTSQNIQVLRENKGERPAILIEVGDIQREVRLVDENYQDQLATNITNGILKTLS